MIISQTKIFNIFHGSIQVSSFSKILTANCKRYTFEDIPTRELWLNRPYFEISNSNKKYCLTIDCRNFNSLGPSKFRTKAESGTEQICYYNGNRRDKSFNRFLALKKVTEEGSIIFEIKNLVLENKTGNFEYFNINDELEEFNNGRCVDRGRSAKRTISVPSEGSVSGSSSANISREGAYFIRKQPRFLSR